MRSINKVGLAVFRDHKIIMARHQKNEVIYFNLGGKIEPGESDLECLQREVREEASTEIDPASIEFLAEFKAPAHGHPDTTIRLRLYRGELLGEPVPASEIAEFRYFDSTYNPRHFTPVTRDYTFPWLKQHGDIN
jgi:8-oxo-dGTP diphosphatase